MKKRLVLTHILHIFRLGFFCLLLLYPFVQVQGCTIFVLTDGKRTMFFNNEDYSNPVTRIWFLPATKKFYGTAYVGFNDGWAQGGVNDHGLAFDWVAGGDGDYKPAPALKPLQGNPAERMLESCKTVKEAIAFYNQFLEPGFGAGRMLVEDEHIPFADARFLDDRSYLLGDVNGKEAAFGHHLQLLCVNSHHSCLSIVCSACAVACAARSGSMTYW